MSSQTLAVIDSSYMGFFTISLKQQIKWINIEFQWFIPTGNHNYPGLMPVGTFAYIVFSYKLHPYKK